MVPQPQEARVRKQSELLSPCTSTAKSYSNPIQVAMQMDTSQLDVSCCVDPIEACSNSMLLRLLHFLGHVQVHVRYPGCDLVSMEVKS